MKKWEKMQKSIITLVGISGTGKTTLGKILAKELNYDYIDLDDFYFPNKPKVRLSDNSVVNNWDTLESINLKEFREKVLESPRNLVIGGFALVDQILPIKPIFTICLEAGHTETEIINRTINARKSSKGFTDEKAKRDELMVREVVYPYYKGMLNLTTVSAYLCTYDSEKKIPIENLIQLLLNYIRD